MISNRIFIAVLTVFFAGEIIAQQPAQEEVGFVYRSEAVGGLMIHTNGWGLTFRYGRQKTYLHKTSYGLDLVNMRHPKEIKVYNPGYDDGKGYYYGKLNSVIIMRPSFGYRRVLFQKKRDQGVEVGFNAAIGPSLAFQKPVYLRIIIPSTDPYTEPDIVEEKYDPSTHHIDNIYGRAATLKGLNETKITPGGFVKFGLLFEYSPEEDGIKALEVGAIADIYPKEIPIMANNQNSFYFLTLYVNIIFGRKYF
ncbi:MAG: hypothetical protein ACOZCO_09030 [Bacteroidota bacterium]